MNRQHWQDWLVALVGLWLILSNWIFNYGIALDVSAPMANIVFWNTLAAGIVALVLGLAAIASFQLWEEWVDIALGVWLVVSPWLLGFAGLRMAMLNVVICGAILILSAGWTLYEERQAGHA